jgi:hypothetical protein
MRSQINTFKPQIFQTSNFNRGKTFGERDPWLHEDRLGRGGAENSGGESRAFGRRESGIFRNNGCLVTGIVEIGIVNRE